MIPFYSYKIKLLLLEVTLFYLLAIKARRRYFYKAKELLFEQYDLKQKIKFHSKQKTSQEDKKGLRLLIGGYNRAHDAEHV